MLRRAIARGGSALTLLIILTPTLLRDSQHVFSSPVAPGVNGYYYVLQIQSLHDRGYAYFSRLTPFVLYFLTAVRYLLGNSILAVKVGAIALQALLCIGIFLFVFQCTGSGWLASAGVLLAAVSGLHLYLMTEFISNLGAITLLVWSGWCCVKFLQKRRKIWALGSLLLLGIAVFSHKSIWAVTILLAVFVVVQKGLFGSSKLVRKVTMLLLLSLWVAPAVIGMQKWISLPAVLANEFVAVPKLPFDTYAFPEEIVLFVISILVLLLLSQKRRGFRSDPADLPFALLSIFAIVVTLNPFCNSDHGGLGIAERLRMLSYVQIAILVPAAIWLLFQTERKKFVAHVAAFVVPMMIVSATLPLPPGLRPSYLERRQRLIQSLANVAVPTSSAIVIAPHGDQFVVTATTGISSQQQPPQKIEYEKVYWLLSEVFDPTLSKEGIVLFSNSDRTTMLVEDTVFKSHFARMTGFSRSELLRSNPHVARFLASKSERASP